MGVPPTTPSPRAPAMSTAHLRPLSFGEILDSAFSLYRRHFVALLSASLVPLIPTMLLTALITRPGLAAGASEPDAFGVGLIPLMLVSFVLGMLTWAALTRMVGEAWAGGEVSVGDGYRRGLRVFLPLVGSTLLVFVILMVALIGALVAGMLLAGMLGAIGLAAGSQTATVVLMIPVLLLAIVVFFAAASCMFGVLPAIVIEKYGPFSAIMRSVRMSRGAVPRVTGIMTVSYLIILLPLLFVMAVTGGFAPFTDPGSVPSAGSFWLQQVANSLTSALTAPFMVASIVILYFDRRVRTEAFDVQLAADALEADAVAAG